MSCNITHDSGNQCTARVKSPGSCQMKLLQLISEHIYLTPLTRGAGGNLQEQKPPLLLDMHCPASSKGPEQQGTE